MTRRILVIGAGGHGRVTADALLARGETVVGFLDHAPALQGLEIMGLPVFGQEETLGDPLFHDCALANGIGGVGRGGRPSTRRLVQERLELAGREFVGVRHPGAIVSRFAVIDPTAQLFASSVVQACARIGRGCVVNTAAVVEHDCDVGAFAHCAPGSLVCGDAVIGEDAHIGAGAVVRQGIRLADGVVVGAGAAVIRDYAGSSTLCGVPAEAKGKP